MLLTHTHRQTNKNRQKHNLLGGGNYSLHYPTACKIDTGILSPNPLQLSGWEGGYKYWTPNIWLQSIVNCR